MCYGKTQWLNNNGLIMLNENYKTFLPNSDLSDYLNAKEWEMLLSHGKVMTFSAGDIILQQGKPSEGIYIILEGEVMISAKMLGEGTTNIEVLTEGNFLGEISFIEKGLCATSATAKTNVTCLYIANTYFDFISTYLPEVKYKILNIITRQVGDRLKKMHNKIINFMDKVDMATTSMFSEIIHSLTLPAEVEFSDVNLEMNKLIQHPIFQSFTQEEREELFKHTILLKAPKRCTLIHKGEKEASCYIVIYGAVQSCVMHDKKAAKLSVIGPATLFASISCIENDSSFTITFITCEPAILLKIPEADLLYIKDNFPLLWFKIFALICKSLVALEKSVDKLDVRLSIENYNR